METLIVGAEIVSKNNRTGIVIDKARGYCNGASHTIYICMDNKGEVFEVEYNGIKKINGFITKPSFNDSSTYLKGYITEKK